MIHKCSFLQPVCVYTCYSRSVQSPSSTTVTFFTHNERRPSAPQNWVSRLYRVFTIRCWVNLALQLHYARPDRFYKYVCSVIIWKTPTDHSSKTFLSNKIPSSTFRRNIGWFTLDSMASHTRKRHYLQEMLSKHHRLLQALLFCMPLGFRRGFGSTYRFHRPETSISNDLTWRNNPEDGRIQLSYSVT